MTLATARDHDVLNHILAREYTDGRLPTHKELCHVLQMSHGQLCRHLNNLVEAGLPLPLPRGTIHYAIAGVDHGGKAPNPNVARVGQ